MIKKCSTHDCVNSFQDRKYGAGNRVMNKLRDSDNGRCTVCGKDSNNVSVKKKK